MDCEPDMVGATERANDLASGVYVVRLAAAQDVAVRRVTVVR